MQADKRWMTIARRRAGGWQVSAPGPVGAVGDLLERLRGLAAGLEGAIAFGIDCPLGLPRAYVARHPPPAESFRGLLARLADDPAGTSAFLAVCDTLEEVGPTRPFYPRRGIRGMSRAAHAAALDLEGAGALSRLCDRATPTRPAGAPVFWTLGANQSGKAAISAWRDLVLPALVAAPDRLRLWPFDGTLADCVAHAPPGTVTLAETYPAEALDQLGLRLVQGGPAQGTQRGSKRRQADRAALAPSLLAAFARSGAIPDDGLQDMAVAGFGSDAAGEDRFDSVVGLLCVLSLLVGQRADHVPNDAWVQRWEGWVLGQRPDGGSDIARPL